MSTIISVVSGKGGCGKSLLAAVLGRAIDREGATVLLVDMDIFVRGLTILLHGFRKGNLPAGLNTTSDILGIFSQDSQNIKPIEIGLENLCIQRFFECDVIPAVDNVAAPLDYNDTDLSNEQFGIKTIHKFISIIKDHYDYIFIDCRAGMDSLITACCKNSDIILAVAEDDDVGRQTNVNLVNFLKFNKQLKKIYTIINKGRNIYSYSDVKERAEYRSEFSVLGVIPFDIEILEQFGSERFWTIIYETLYFRALIDSWNALSKYEKVIEIAESKYRFPPTIFMGKKQGRFSLIERMLRIYSVLFIFTGIFVWLFKQYSRGDFNYYDVIIIISIFLGVITLLMSTSNLRIFLLGLSEEKKRK